VETLLKKVGHIKNNMVRECVTHGWQ